MVSQSLPAPGFGVCLELGSAGESSPTHTPWPTFHKASICLSRPWGGRHECCFCGTEGLAEAHGGKEK